MERFILNDLIKWKNSKYRKPLILKGVRQVGKTWILKEFGDRYYENIAYFNFDENPEYKQFFQTTKDINRILQNLMLISGYKIVAEKTLIIFDEIQNAPEVINSLKYFYENAPEYHIACAGSLLGITLAKPSSFPVGKVDFLNIYPMSFSEFLLANGDENLKLFLDSLNDIENIPDARVKYIPAETFINDFLEHLRLGEMDSFKKIYRSLDLLLIDDIQSLGGKKVSTQEEFFNTFNALHGENKQIVLTSDRSPDHLDNLEERLVTRFKWGLTQNITPPDFETRIAILRNKIEDLDYIFPNDTLEYLAGQFDSNVRDLEGALNDISLIARVRHLKEITIDIAAEAIRARKQDSSQVTVIPIDKIQSEVGKFYGVSVKEMKGSRRVQNIVLARQVAMYLTRELTDNSLPKIGREFGGKDHTTVIHAHGKIKTMIESDDNLRLEIESIKNKIK